MAVTVYEHANFGGRSQIFGPGTHLANQGDFSEIGNDTISSLIVPFGYAADLAENEGHDANGDGLRAGYQMGRHTSVENRFNDKCSWLRVYPWTDFYLNSREADLLPFLGGVRSIGITVTWRDDRRGGYSDVGGGLNIGADRGDLHKAWEIPIPPGIDINVWEATRANNASGDYSIKDGVLRVWLRTKPTPFLGAANWIGLRASVK